MISPGDFFQSYNIPPLRNSNFFTYIHYFFLLLGISSGSGGGGFGFWGEVISFPFGDLLFYVLLYRGSLFHLVLQLFFFHLENNEQL